MKNLKRMLVGLALVAACSAGALASGKPNQPDLKGIGEKFHATFPSTPVDEVRESEVPELYEIYTGPKILYYAPKENAVVFGEIYSANGISFTQAKLDVRAQKRMSNIDKSVALTLGDGPTELIAFVDPDCPHCRRAYKWLTEQKFSGVKELIYFMPLRNRPAAEARVEQALCAPPELRQAALSQVFDPDPNQSTPVLGCPEAAETLRSQAKIAEEVGVSGTPFFFVKGQAITGFDRERLASLLGNHKE
jgi:thiol:disulfide interchange protein DsbC